jgi:hypothetical protein
MLDYGVTEAHIYNQGVEIPYVHDYTAGPYTVIPFSNFLIYMPFKGYYQDEYGLTVLYDETNTKRMILSAGNAVHLLASNVTVEKGTPFILCGLSGNTWYSKIAELGFVYSYYGNGFTFALCDIEESVIFPDGVLGGVQPIQGTALPSNSQVLIYYHRLRSASDNSPSAMIRERGTGALPSEYSSKYLDFVQWSTSQTTKKAVSDTDASFQFIFAWYTAKPNYKKSVHSVDVPIHYSKYGNPLIPDEAPASIPIMFRVHPNTKQITSLTTLAPVFYEFNLSWYTSQNLYASGWRVLQSTINISGDWQTRGLADGTFNFGTTDFTYSISGFDEIAVFVAPESAYIEKSPHPSKANILLLDKAAGVDEIKEYDLQTNSFDSLFVHIDTNPVQYVKAWRGITCSIARYMKEIDTDSEHYPPSDFYDINQRGGLQWGSFGILEWTPNAANYDTSGEPDIIPILFLLSHIGKFQLNF